MGQLIPPHGGKGLTCCLLEGAELEVREDALAAIAKRAMKRKTGARGLRMIRAARSGEKRCAPHRPGRREISWSGWGWGKDWNTGRPSYRAASVSGPP